MKRTLCLTGAALGAALFSFGCATGTDETEPTEPTEQAQEPQAAEPEPKEATKHQGKMKHHRRGHGHHGAKGGHLLRAALKYVDLTDEQRTKIEAVADGLKRDRDPEARKARKEKLIAAIRSGDVSALSAAPADVEKHAREKAAKITSALNELHSILDADQRKQLTEAVAAKMKKRAQRRAAWGDDGDWAHKKLGRRGFGAHKIERMARKLDLTEEQRGQLEEARKKAETERPSADEMKKRFEERRAHVEAMIAAFEKDDFDAKTLGLEQRFAERAKQKVSRKTKHLAVLVPILTDDQRAKLADTMQERLENPRSFRKPGRFGKHGRFGHGPGRPGFDRPAADPSVDDVEL